MLKIDHKLMEEIDKYCQLNSIIDVDLFCSKLLETAFNIEKYGIISKQVKKVVDTPHIDTQRNEKLTKINKTKSTIYDENYE